MTDPTGQIIDALMAAGISRLQAEGILAGHDQVRRTAEATTATPKTVDPLTVRWDREVWHAESITDDTVVCCLADDGQPVALLLDDEHREALGLLLADPEGESECASDFFETGRTYTEPGDTTDWKFRVDHITTHPDDGERTALGWRHFHGEWEPYAYGEDDFEIHQTADVLGAEAGVADA